MSAITRSLVKPRLSVKAQTLAALLAAAAAVALPQFFHALGAASGLGTALGETFLPMHLPIILVGLLAGPYAGAAAGLLAPLTSHMLTGMPGQLMLPFIMAELCAYGVFSGLLGNVKLPDTVKVLSVQLLGRAVRAGAVLIAVFALGSDSVKLSSIWTMITVGLPGIVLQLVLLPLLMYRIRDLKRHDS